MTDLMECESCGKNRPESFKGCKRADCPFVARPTNAAEAHAAEEGHKVEYDYTDQAWYCWHCSWASRDD